VWPPAFGMYEPQARGLGPLVRRLLPDADREYALHSASALRRHDPQLHAYGVKGAVSRRSLRTGPRTYPRALREGRSFAARSSRPRTGIRDPGIGLEDPRRTAPR